MTKSEELRRISNFYNDKEWREQHSIKYSFFDEANIYVYQARDRAVLRALKLMGIKSLAEKKILEIGCGRGGELINFIRYGASSDNLFGVDLMDYRIVDALKNNPAIHFSCGDASQLNVESGTFDIATQFMAFTSIIDDALKKQIALEMVRVTKPGGLILWVDFYITNPFNPNPNVKAIRKSEINNLFYGHKIHLTRCVLARPIVTVLSKRSILLCQLFEKLSVFNSFYVGIIEC